MSIPDSKAKSDWIKKNTVFVGLKLNRNTDADIIAELEQVESRQGYIKSVIRQDLKK